MKESTTRRQLVERLTVALNSHRDDFRRASEAFAEAPTDRHFLLMSDEAHKLHHAERELVDAQREYDALWGRIAK